MEKEQADWIDSGDSVDSAGSAKHEWKEECPDPSSFPSSGLFHDEGLTPAKFLQYMQNITHSKLKMDYEGLHNTFNSKEVKISNQNRDKNRYADIPCLDKTRVILKDSMPGDYIHASYADGYKQAKAYIIAQGPKENTTVDFWRMIWQEEALVVVAVTRMVENGGFRCSSYWPQIEKQVIRYGPFVVRNAQTVRQEKDHWTVSSLEVRKICSDEGMRNLYHIHYLDWQDKSVPSDVKGLLKVLDLIHDRQSLLLHQYRNWKGHPLGPPIIIHCSAGIGRSATLALVDICIRRLLSGGSAEVRSTLEKMRTQRHGAVQLFLFTMATLIPGDIKTEPHAKLVFNAPFSEKNRYHVTIANLGAHRIGWAIKTTNMK